MLGRYAVVLDKKRQGAEGEYSPIAREMGTEPVKFLPGGGPGASRINLLVPGLEVGTGDNAGGADGRPAGQLALVRAVIDQELGAKRALSAKGVEALRIALLAAPARAHDDGPRRGGRVGSDLVLAASRPGPSGRDL